MPRTGGGCQRKHRTKGYDAEVTTKAPAPGTTTTVTPESLHAYHRNPRRGDVPAIMASLRANGQYKPIVVNLGTRTGRPNEVLAGNHTLLAIDNLRRDEPDDPRWATVTVHWIDVDDQRCRDIVLADNRTAELGGFDTAELLALLEDVALGDLSSVGYSIDDLADMRALLEESNDAYGDLVFSDPVANDITNPGQRGDGLINQKDLTTQRNEYADMAANRMVVLTLPIQRFVWFAKKLDAYREAFGLDTNTDAAVHMLEAWSGESAPAVPGDDS